MLTFNFSPFPELRTNRLILRKLSPEDAPELYSLRSDELVIKYLARKPAASVAVVRDFILQVNQNVESNTSILWGIALNNKPGELIGTICFWNLEPENHRAEIGYMLHPHHWHKGIMKEALDVVMDYGFNQMKLNRVEAKLSNGNDASEFLLVKSGFTKEAFLRQDIYFGGEFIDSLIYSKLASDHRMNFREATLEDIQQIQVVRNSVKENMLSDPNLVPDKDVADYITNRGKGWVCEVGDTIVGFSIISITDNNVWALFVKPGYEKKGIGRILHDLMMDWYFNQTSTTAWLGTAPGTRAESFYRRAGWTNKGMHGSKELKFEMRAEDWTSRI
jgi:RimJ/RimL family protein N-acetyltransferase